MKHTPLLRSFLMKWACSTSDPESMIAKILRSEAHFSEEVVETVISNALRIGDTGSLKLLNDVINSERRTKILRQLTFEEESLKSGDYEEQRDLLLE